MNKQQGVVLPLALIVITIMVTMASILLVRSNAEIDEAALVQEQWQARLKINDAEQELLLSMFAGEQLPGGYNVGDLFIPTDGTFIKLKNGVEVAVQDLAGLLSLHYLRRAELVRLFTGYTDEQQATDIVNHIIRWQRQNADGEALALERNAPFRSLDELMLIPGITPDMFNDNDERPGLRSVLALSGSSFVNFAAVPDFLLVHAFGLTDNDVSRVTSLKERRKWDDISAMIFDLGIAVDQSLIPSSRYRVLYKYNGVSARAEYQVRTTIPLPPRKRLWYFPDHERHFLMSTAQ
ncbi:type II secretion system protein GspK [Oceanimonas smirnovii]|uniref:type II secretion system protein GspK n=1 Tax=Oceanimonas smirnovii TaxID=264574 RepID=UPI00037ACCAF|nr:type II secretion system protein GspK [Oceanimonas smirnovii]